jgi:hypothetical protein
MSQTDTSEDPVIVPHNGNGKAVEQVAPSLMDLIAQASAHGNIDALERLIALYERNNDRQREIAAKQAFVRMHHEMPQIEKKGKVDTTTQRGANIKYGFAQLEDIDEIARPIMAKHGFGLTFRPIEQTADYLVVEGELIHEETGWSFTARKQEPIDKNAHMGLQQKGGTAQTFGIRYLTVALLNIVVKGEDTDGRRDQDRERGPVSPPPSEKSMGNKWAKDREVVLKNSGADWWKVLASDFNMAENSEDLEALVDIVRDNVNTLDAGKQKTIGANLMKARNRLSRPEPAPEKFDFLVRNAEGETDGELFADAAAWVREFKEYWNTATGADDRENLLHHNADALAVARRTNAFMLKDIDDWCGETGVKEKAEGIVPFAFDAVQPPMNNGKPSWSAWFKLLVGEMDLPTDEDLTSWVEAQKTVLADAEILYRLRAVNQIASAMTKRKIEKPDWLRGMILPINAACNHTEWAVARIAELHWITDKTAFDEAIKAARPRMGVMKNDDKEAFASVKVAFETKQGEFP